MKKFFYIFLLSFTSIFCCFAMDKEKTTSTKLIFSQKELNLIAVTNGYGFKYGNLSLLTDLTKQFNEEEKPPYTVKVPQFVGISSKKIQKFFSNPNFKIADEWAKFVKQNLPIQDKDKILTEKKFPNGFEEARATFEKNLRDAFNAKIQEALNNKFSFDDSFEIKGADDLIKQVDTQKIKFMVRSTGKEDTKELANAGGNVSVANVEPNTKEILESIKEVVISYFGAKSLTQRLGAGDKSLFYPKPFTPVLIQIMIGETNPQKLPKCGVMFTEETEGGISKLNEKDDSGKIKTTGITVIQCAYGHNEGVVNSLIPVDTFYVDHSENIYPVIRPKTYRMMPSPTEKRTLNLEKNPDDVIDTSALNPKAVMTIKKFSDTLESYYKCPMDVEFVVKEDEQTIYIVQARPIVHNKKAIQPSYLLYPDKISKENKLEGRSIGVAGGALRWITNPTHIVVAADIGEALKIYQYDKTKVPDCNLVQAIIVGKMAPATSHEATTFRSELKPVIYLEQWNKVNEWLNGTKIVVDPQQGLIVNWPGDETSIEQILQNERAKNGWCSYPIPQLASLEEEFKTQDNNFEQTIKTLLENTDLSIEALSKEPEKAWEPFVKESLQIIKTSNKKDACIALARILYQFNKTIEAQAGEFDEHSQNFIDLMTGYLIEYVKRVHKVLDLNPNDLVRLFPIRFLESLLQQQTSPQETINGLSATILLEMLIKEKGFIQELPADLRKKVSPKVILHMHIANLALTPELDEKWKQFGIALTKIDEVKQNDFTNLILNIYKLEMLPMWLNTSFDNAYEKTQNPEELITALSKEYSEANSEKFLDTLLEQKNKITAFNIEVFGEPKNFKKQWEDFKKDILNYFLNDKFINDYKTTNNFGKTACISIMNKFLDTFDRSIKALRGNIDLKADEETIVNGIKNYQIMLKSYYEFYEKIVSLTNNPMPLGIETSLKKVPTKEDLKAAPSFDASLYLLNRWASRKTQKLEDTDTTLEEIFTIIHQASLNTLSKLNSDAGTSKIQKPQLIQKIDAILLGSNIQKTIESGDKVNLIGTNINANTASWLYNIPLRMHSAQVEIIYDKNKKATTAKIIIYSDAYGKAERFYTLAAYVNLLAVLNCFQISDYKFDPKAIQFSINITQEKIKDLEVHLFNLMTLASNFKQNLFNQLFQSKNIDAKNVIETIKELEQRIGIETLSHTIDIFTNLLVNYLRINKDDSYVWQLTKNALVTKRKGDEGRPEALKEFAKKMTYSLIENLPQPAEQHFIEKINKNFGLDNLIKIDATILYNILQDFNLDINNFIQGLINIGLEKEFIVNNLIIQNPELLKSFIRSIQKGSAINTVWEILEILNTKRIDKEALQEELLNLINELLNKVLMTDKQEELLYFMLFNIAKYTTEVTRSGTYKNFIDLSKNFNLNPDKFVVALIKNNVSIKTIVTESNILKLFIKSIQQNKVPKQIWDLFNHSLKIDIYESNAKMLITIINEIFAHIKIDESYKNLCIDVLFHSLSKIIIIDDEFEQILWQVFLKLEKDWPLFFEKIKQFKSVAGLYVLAKVIIPKLIDAKKYEDAKKFLTSVFDYLLKENIKLEEENIAVLMNLFRMFNIIISEKYRILYEQEKSLVDKLKTLLETIPSFPPKVTPWLHFSPSLIPIIKSIIKNRIYELCDVEQIINPILSICIENIDYLRAAGSIPALIDSFADTKNIVTLHQNEALKKLKDNLRKLILEEVENLVKNKVPSKTNTLGIIQVIINYKLLEEAPADFSKKYNDLITNTMRKGFEENLIFIKTILQKIQRQELPVLTPKQEKVFIDKLCESMNNAYIFEYSAGKHNIHIELTLGEIFSIWQSRWDIILEQIKKDKSVGELYILAVGVITTLVNKNSPLEAKQFLNFILNAANEITFKDKNSTDFMKLLQLIFSNKFSILYTKDFTLNLKISKLLTTVLKKSKGEKGPLYQFISLIETTLNNQNFKLNKEQEQLIKDVIFHAMEQYYEWPSHIDQTVLITFGNIFDLLKTQWPEMQKQIQERKSPQLLVILGEILKLIQVKKNPEAIQFLNCIFNTLDIITIDENNLDIFLDLITVLISDEYITFYTQNTEFVQSLKKHLTIILNKADKKFSQKLVVLLKSIIQNKLYTIFDISDNILKIIENIKFDMDLLPIFLDEKNLPHIKNNIFSKTESLTKLKEALQKQILLYYNTIKDRKEKTPDDQTKKSIKQLVSEFVLQEKAPNDFITAYQKIVE